MAKKKTVSVMPGHKPTSARDKSLDTTAEDTKVTTEGVEAAETQAPLLPDVEVQEPEPVQNGRFLGTFLGPKRFTRAKGGDPLITLEFSIELSEELRDLVPHQVVRAWDYLEESEDKSVTVQGLDAQTLDLYLDPKDKKSATRLHLVGASITNCVVAHVKETGKGREKEYIRVKFSAMHGQDNEMLIFAGNNHGNLFWFDLHQTQGKLAHGAT